MKLGKYIAGALSGLTFGLLFAPKKGGDLRKEMKKKGAKSGHDALSVLIDAFKEAGTEALDEAKQLSEVQSLESAIGNSKEKMKEYFSQIEKTGYDIAARAKEKLDELHDVAEDASVNFKKTAVKKAKVVKKAVARSKKAVKATKMKVGDLMNKAEKKIKKAKPVAKKAVKKTAPKKVVKSVAKKPAKKPISKSSIKKVAQKTVKGSIKKAARKK